MNCSDEQCSSPDEVEYLSIDVSSLKFSDEVVAIRSIGFI